MKLQELFDKTVNYEYNSNDRKVEASFSIDDITYNFYAVYKSTYPDHDMSKEKYEYWEILFYAKSAKNHFRVFDALPANNRELLVFSTILKIIREFIQDKHEPNILFSAKGDKQHLYEKMMKAFSSKYGYKLVKTELDYVGSNEKYYSMEPR